MREPPKVLVIGYGNPGRGDDGLGPALAEAAAALDARGVTVETAYQLQVEDAAAVSAHDVAIFADATVAGTEPFTFREIEPACEVGFSTHSVSPGEVLALARDIFGGAPRAYVLAIRGYAFGAFDERLSAGARSNLDAATAFLEQVLRSGVRILTSAPSATEPIGLTRTTDERSD